METTLVVFFEKIIVYMPGKFWDGKNLAFCGQNLAIFWPKLTVLEFLTYNFQTQLWILLIFGIELLWILTLSGEPIILCLVGIEVLLMAFFEKIIIYMPGKKFYMAKFWTYKAKIWPFLTKIDSFESFWPKGRYESS